MVIILTSLSGEQTAAASRAAPGQRAGLPFSSSAPEEAVRLSSIIQPVASPIHKAVPALVFEMYEKRYIKRERKYRSLKSN